MTPFANIGSPFRNAEPVRALARTRASACALREEAP
jgi:hypothetical protein